MEVSIDRAGILDAVGTTASEYDEVAAAYLYGSASTDSTTGLSDVDVALLFGDGEPGDRRRSVIAATFGSALARRLREVSDGRPPEVDVRDLEALPLAVQGSVLTDGTLAASTDEVRRVRFEELTRRRYFDFLPLLERDVKEGLRGLRERFVNG